MRSLLISPHDDDSCLFAAFTCLRAKPLVVVVVLDSYIQPNRGERGCSADERAAETAAAHAILGVQTFRCRLRDDTASFGDILSSVVGLITGGNFRTVYAPAWQIGNIHHDQVARAAEAACGHLGVTLKQYTTYTRTHLYTTGNTEIVPAAEELELKNRALECYVSQLRINRPHFDAVRGKSEWLM